ncbi:RNA-directed DNA polymerase from mobile element jockey [Merluccius polli]|uniref:RNA-directed DNA polymerase from mobile element jockey n=1 Tax=Merluccius polli TaxID=89951 RepID=A0AA47NAM6_MERPO|nr:RNA-directed DNA polymerase from mobile element jockey [Merluccius polli]
MNSANERVFRSGDKEELGRVQKELRQKIRKGKDNYRRKLEKWLEQNKARDVWSGLQNIAGHRKGVGRDQASVHYPPLNPPLRLSPLITPTPPPQSSSTPLSITDDQVRTQLRNIKGWKAPGPDGISPRLLKDCADQLCGVFRHLFNLSLSLEKVPALWKTSCVVPVSKTPHPKEPNHFRPVALTSHLMKTMERIILRHLRTLVGTQLDSLQFAYQPGIGVDDALIYMLHRSLLHLEGSGSTVRVMFFDFSSAFNTIKPSLLKVKMGVEDGTWEWTDTWLHGQQTISPTDHTQVLSPFLFTLYTSDFTHNTTHCHIQKFSDDTAIVGCVSEGNDLEYRTVIRDFVSWSELNQLQLNTSKTKEMIVNFRRKASHFTPVNIQGLDIEVVESYKFLGVHLNNKLNWTDNTHALYKKGQSRLHLLRRLRSFGVCKALLRTFYDSVMASAIFYAVVCWRAGSTDRDRSRLNKLIRRASSVLDGPLDSIEELGERRMLTKLTSIMDNTSHPLHDTVGSLRSSFSSRLLHPRCKKERFRRSFIPAAVR